MGANEDLWGCILGGGGGGHSARVLRRHYPFPPPGLRAFDQDLVAKGVALRRSWAPKSPMLHERQMCPKEIFLPFATQNYP